MMSLKLGVFLIYLIKKIYLLEKNGFLFDGINGIEAVMDQIDLLYQTYELCDKDIPRFLYQIPLNKAVSPELKLQWINKLLNLSIIAGNIDLVIEILNQKVFLLDPSITFDIAVYYRKTEICQLLMNYFLQNNIHVEHYLDALNTASELGYEEIVRLILQENIHPQLIHDAGILKLAIENNHLSIILLLLNAGANPNCPDKNGDIPLHYSSVNSESEMKPR